MQSAEPSGESIGGKRDTFVKRVTAGRQEGESRVRTCIRSPEIITRCVESSQVLSCHLTRATDAPYDARAMAAPHHGVVYGFGVCSLQFA
ncbi:MAG: hypothetical protein ACYC4U_07900 [Pirellulaceae bacterium]